MNKKLKKEILNKIFKENKDFVLLNKKIFNFLNNKGLLKNNKYFILDNYEEYIELKNEYKNYEFYYISNNNLEDLNNFLVLLKNLSKYYNLKDLKDKILSFTSFNFDSLKNIEIKETEEMKNLISNLLLLNLVSKENLDKEEKIEIELKNLHTIPENELLKYSKIIFLLDKFEELEDNLYYILLLKDIKKEIEIKFKNFNIADSREKIVNLLLLLSNLKININIENLEESVQKYLLDIIAEEDLYLKGLIYDVDYIPEKYKDKIFIIK